MSETDFEKIAGEFKEFQKFMDVARETAASFNMSVKAFLVSIIDAIDQVAASGLSDDDSTGAIAKVNIPGSRKAFEQGNGESVAVFLDEDTARAYEDDSNTGGTYHGRLAHDSACYPDLHRGDDVEFELRGKARPVATWDWVQRKVNRS